MSAYTDRLLALARQYSYCGKPEPTGDCGRVQECDYHSGWTPDGVPVGEHWSKPFVPKSYAAKRRDA